MKNVKAKKQRKNAFLKDKKPRFAWLAFLRKLVLPCVWIGFGTTAGVYLFPVAVEVFNPPIQKVVVNGDFLYLEKTEVVKNIDIYADDRLLDVKLRQVQEKLEAMPWVFSAQVVRTWPGKITINVKEQKPIAKWNQDYLLNHYGELFARQNKVVRGVPELSGEQQQAEDVLDRYQEFSSLLVPYGLQILSLKQNARGGWFASLSNDMELILGRDEALNKMRHFVVLYDQELQFANKAAEVVDLRYGNGAAVRWKPTRSEMEEVASRG